VHGNLAQEISNLIVDRVDLPGGAAIAKRRPDDQVDEKNDRDLPAAMRSPIPGGRAADELSTHTSAATGLPGAIRLTPVPGALRPHLGGIPRIIAWE